jgi:hypothetical protein
MSCSNFTTILTYFNDALLQRLVNSAFIAGESINDHIEPELILFNLCPASSDDPGKPSEVNQNKLKNVVSDTQTIQRQVGEILADAVKSEPVYAEQGQDLAPLAEQKLHYLGVFIDSLTRLINGKQNLDITKNQMISQAGLPMISQAGLPKDFSAFLDQTLPAIAKAADSRRNNIKELNKDFVLNFKKVVKDDLGDNALTQLELLDSLIVENLALVHEGIKESEQYLDFNLDRYAPELTQNISGQIDGLNIYIGVDLQGHFISDDLQYPLRQSMRLQSIADNIKNAGFPVTDVSDELGEGFQQVYKIAIPL